MITCLLHLTTNQFPAFLVQISSLTEVQVILTKYLLGVRHCFRYWGFSSEQKPSVPPLMELLQLFFLTTLYYGFYSYSS